MKISKITDAVECYKNTSTKTTLQICVNGLRSLEADIVDKSPTLSLYGHVADDAGILDMYRGLRVGPYHRIKCYKCNMLGDIIIFTGSLSM